MRFFNWIKTHTLDHPAFALVMNSRFRRGAPIWVFIAFLLLIGIIAVLAYAGFSGNYERRGDPFSVTGYGGTDSGQTYFVTLVVTMSIICTLLSVGFGCTSINGERLRKTYEFLVTTSSSSEFIVFGKFFSFYSQVLIFIFACAPFLMLSLYLGGLDTMSVLFSIYMLFLLTSANLLVSMALSAVSPIQATSVVLSFMFCGGLTSMADSAIVLTLKGFRRGSTGADDFLLAMLLISTVTWFVVVSLCFIGCSVALKNRFSNRTAAFKMWFAGALLSLVGLALYLTLEYKSDDFDKVGYYAFVTVVALFSYICIEDNIFHPKLEERWKGMWYPMRPGGSRNYVFAIIAVCAGLAALWIVSLGEDSVRTWYYARRESPVVIISVYIAAWTLFMYAIALFIGAHKHIFKRPAMIHTVALTFVLVLYPFIRFMVSAIASRSTKTPFDVYICPFWGLTMLFYEREEAIVNAAIVSVVMVVAAIFLISKSHTRVEYLKGLIYSKTQ